MTVNYGKKFENIIREAFEKVPNVSVDRVHDQTTGFRGSSNICDFIVYKEPYEYYIECKSVHGNTLPFSNITDTQWNGLLEKSQIEGVFAGIICWWIDKDVTRFLPIQYLQKMKETVGAKSVRYDLVHNFGKYTGGEYKGEYCKCVAVSYEDEHCCIPLVEIYGKKKRVFFDYDVESFLKMMAIQNNIYRNPQELDTYPKESQVWWTTIDYFHDWRTDPFRKLLLETTKPLLPDELQEKMK